MPPSPGFQLQIFLGLPLVEGRTENRKDKDCIKSQGPFVTISEYLKSQTLLFITGTCSLKIHPGIRNTEHFMQDMVTNACNHSTREGDRSKVTLSCLEFKVKLSYRRPDFKQPRLSSSYLAQTPVCFTITLPRQQFSE